MRVSPFAIALRRIVSRAIAAAAVGIMLPVVAFVALMQRHLARGLAMGAVKG